MIENFEINGVIEIKDADHIGNVLKATGIFLTPKPDGDLCKPPTTPHDRSNLYLTCVHIPLAMYHVGLSELLQQKQSQLHSCTSHLNSLPSILLVVVSISLGFPLVDSNPHFGREGLSIATAMFLIILNWPSMESSRPLNINKFLHFQIYQQTI
ncbi:hypothetical protein QQP08_001471 [Theobroma cacao]|nr:hypothetical protein QQP08_001471 [Theobroma cacao]